MAPFPRVPVLVVAVAVVVSVAMAVVWSPWLGVGQTAGPAWESDEDGLPGYAIATGLAVGPDDVGYVAAYREGAVYTLRPGDDRWSSPAAFATMAAYSVSAHPRTPGVAIAGTVAGVYRTTDAGHRWQRTGDDQPVYAVAFAADGRAWAGRAGDLLRSDDEGQSWQVVATLPPTVTVLSLAPLPDGQVAIGSGGAGILRFGPDGLRVISATHQFVSAIAADSAGRIVARVEGQVWRGGVSAPWQRVDLPVTMAVASGPTGFLAATEREGVWQSVDGVTWRSVGGAIRGTVYAVAGGRSLWAATNQAVLRHDGQRWAPTAGGYGRPLTRWLAAGYGALFAATADGVYRRDADGWRPVGRDLADTLTLAVLPTGPTTIVAGAWERGVMKTDDGGRSWETMTEFEYSRAIIPALAADGATLVARVEYARVLRSVDGGDSWTLADRGMLTRTVFSVSAYGGQFFAGTDAGVYRWVDGEWRPLPGQPADGIVTALLATPTGPVAGTVDGLWRATATGWERAGLRGRHVVSILPGPDGAALAVATADDGAFVRRDGAWRRLGPSDVRLNSIAIDPRDDSLVAAAETGVFRLRGWR